VAFDGIEQILLGIIIGAVDYRNSMKWAGHVARMGEIRTVPWD